MKLVSAVPLDAGQREALQAIIPGLEIADSAKFLSVPEVGQLDEDTEILYAFRVQDDLMERAPNLKWLQLIGAGADHLNGHPILESGVQITNASGVHATPIAEYVLGVMLGFYRWLPQAVRAQANREWLSQADVSRGSRELRRRTVGIVGYGSIGREVARLAKPFGTRILASKRNPAQREELGYAIEETGDPTGALPERFYGPDELMDMLPECDVVVLAVPATGDTHRIMDAQAFAAMKPGSFLVNIARGSVVDHEALITALQNGPMAGAALDVFDEEPLPKDSPLWDIENLIVTPHISGANRAHLRRTFELFTGNLSCFIKGDAMLNIVDKTQGY